MVKEQDIFKALATVEISKADISGLQIGADGFVQFAIEVDPQQGAALEPMRQKSEDVVARIKGVKNVRAILTAQKPAPKALDHHGMNKNPPLANLNIKKIIAVASGKGGVGKSTIAVNLAHALVQSGKSVGLLDADIYGPSVPMMTGQVGLKPETRDGKLVPLEKQGLQIMSIGFLTDSDQALIWRGPMVQSALYQMLRDVAWGAADKPLDVLVIDMPPGTGDAQLTLAQKVPVDGAVIVSTPQDIALIDARKAVEMFRKTNVPILGLIENMSTHICTNCGHEEHIFGHGGAEKEAEKLKISFLGSIPLDMNIRISSDAGGGVTNDKAFFPLLELARIIA